MREQAPCPIASPFVYEGGPLNHVCGMDNLAQTLKVGRAVNRGSLQFATACKSSAVHFCSAE